MPSKIEKALVEKLNEGPFLVEDVLYLSNQKNKNNQRSIVLNTLRKKIKEYMNIKIVIYKGQSSKGKRCKNKTKHFVLVCKFKHRRKAWKMLEKRLDLPYNKFERIAKPLCGDLIKNIAFTYKKSRESRVIK